MSHEDVLLEVNHLHTGFKINDAFYDAVDDVSLKLHRNEKLAIVGESGCGKSTLATSIIGLHNRNQTKQTGEVLYKGDNLLDYSEEDYLKIRGKEMSMIFQDPLASLNPLMTIFDQIEESLYYHTDMDKKARKARVMEFSLMITQFC